jgi:hypothetical protein
LHSCLLDVISASRRGYALGEGPSPGKWKYRRMRRTRLTEQPSCTAPARSRRQPCSCTLSFTHHACHFNIGKADVLLNRSLTSLWHLRMSSSVYCAVRGGRVVYRYTGGQPTAKLCRHWPPPAKCSHCWWPPPTIDCCMPIWRYEIGFVPRICLTRLSRR